MKRLPFLFLAFLFFLPATSIAKELPKIAIWDLSHRNIPQDYSQQLTDILATEVTKLGIFEVYSQENVRTLAGWEAQKVQLGCNDSKCLTALGQMDIAKLISGSVGKLGNRYSISLSLFDTAAVKSENRVSEFCNSENELIELIQVAVRKLLGEEQAKVVRPPPPTPPATKPSQPQTPPSPPSTSTAGETARDGRFIAYNNGTVLDTQTNLMWAAKDNGSDIKWTNAKSYCENYRGGGYTDWRMPTLNELAGLYDTSKSYKPTQENYYIYLTELIQLSACCPWASGTRGSAAALFGFVSGILIWSPQSIDGYGRALPVRSGK